ncbi:hypothetical protein ACFPPD_23885 [Cohnella suwonensis]|uniref:STAS/SEC14 domain-containing protein n=1 Tax=Cohnella suwonensis TaxID=696072 RepID=A0ABW0M145_9BACL
MVYYDSPFAQVLWNDIIEAAVLQWIRDAHGDHFRTPMEKVLELANLRQAKKVLYDTRLLFEIAEDDRQWASNDMYPRLLQSEIRFAAAVLPVHILTKPLYNEVSAGAGSIPIVFGHFANLEEAGQWLYEID